MLNKCVVVVFYILFLGKSAFGSNILYLETVPSPSHHIWNKAIAFKLAEKGHNVTLFGHDGNDEKLPKNVHLIHIADIYSKLNDDFDWGSAAEANPALVLLNLYTWANIVCEFDLNSPSLDRLLNYPKDFKFDLIMVDVSLGQCLLPIIDRFQNASVIAVTPFLLPLYVAEQFGNHLATSYVPHFLLKKSKEHMSLAERGINIFYSYAEQVYRDYIFTPRQMSYAREKFGANIRHIRDIERDMHLLLANTDPVLDYPMPLAPNVIPIGGLHARPAKSLPKDLSQIMNNSIDGVVLFSLGTNIKSSKLKPEVREALLKAFAKLPVTVVWKFESDDIENLPKNVIIRKWLPQNDILGHHKTKAFISHGGALSTQESMYHGVPVIGIPFFMDQRLNVAKLVGRKLGLEVDFKTLTSQTIYNAVQEILNNPIYSENMKKLSTKFKDRPLTNLETAVYWVEHVLKNGPTTHLDIPTRDMTTLEVYNLDLILIVFVIVIIELYLIKKLFLKVIDIMKPKQKKE